MAADFVTRDDSASWEGGRGRIGRAHFQSVLHDPRDTLCFVCGPSAMVADLPVVLTRLGVPRRNIKLEKWSS